MRAALTRAISASGAGKMNPKAHGLWKGTSFSSPGESVLNIVDGTELVSYVETPELPGVWLKMTAQYKVTTSKTPHLISLEGEMPGYDDKVAMHGYYKFDEAKDSLVTYFPPDPNVTLPIEKCEATAYIRFEGPVPENTLGSEQVPEEVKKMEPKDKAVAYLKGLLLLRKEAEAIKRKAIDDVEFNAKIDQEEEQKLTTESIKLTVIYGMNDERLKSLIDGNEEVKQLAERVDKETKEMVEETIKKLQENEEAKKVFEASIPEQQPESIAVDLNEVIKFPAVDESSLADDEKNFIACLRETFQTQVETHLKKRKSLMENTFDPETEFDAELDALKIVEGIHKKHDLSQEKLMEIVKRPHMFPFVEELQARTMIMSQDIMNLMMARPEILQRYVELVQTKMGGMNMGAPEM